MTLHKTSRQTTSPDGQLLISYNSALPTTETAQPNTTADAQTVALAKSGRIVVPVPATPETVSVQTAAMASPVMAQQVALALAPSVPSNNAAAAIQTAALASTAPVPATTAVKNATASAPGAITTSADPRAQAIALDEKELTPDMVALQKVIPTPRPDTSTLAYAAQPKAVAALAAIDTRTAFPPAPGEPLPSTINESPAELTKLIKRYSGLYGVPESLVHRVVHRESRYDPKAYHRNGYWGLMQISYPTAKSMGYEGPAEGLLDAETNLKYAIKYLRGAWLVADNSNDNAIRLYARGYYYDAKRRGMLHVLSK